MIYLSATDVVTGGCPSISIRADRASISKCNIGAGLCITKSGMVVDEHVEFRHVQRICVNTPITSYDYNELALSRSLFGQNGSMSASEGSKIRVLGA